jgi:hypothetical protein
MHSVLIVSLIGLQSFVVVFIALHDWVPLGSLNNVIAVQSADSKQKLVVVTLLSTLPFAVGLGGTIFYAGSRFPQWLYFYLWISYGSAIYGLIRAWWAPYLLYYDPTRSVRYEAMFGDTHAFLPARNGIRPNTLHVSLHLVILAVVANLALLNVYRAG